MVKKGSNLADLIENGWRMSKINNKHLVIYEKGDQKVFYDSMIDEVLTSPYTKNTKK